MRVERLIDLPRAIVWDALIDPVLVEGWLHPVRRLVDDEPASRVSVRLDPAVGAAARLHLSSSEWGELRLTLLEVPGGRRGSSTAITVEVLAVADPRFRGPVVTGWQTRLDQLEDLLLGHPVDWQAVGWPSASGDDGPRARHAN